MDPIPKDITQKTSEAFNQPWSEKEYEWVSSDNERYLELSEAQKSEWDKEDAAKIAAALDEVGIGTLVGALVDYRDDEKNQSTAQDPFSMSNSTDTPREILNVVASNAVAGPAQFVRLPKNLQQVYLLSRRAEAMSNLIYGSSYSDVNLYGRLPEDVIAHEFEELYRIIEEVIPGVIDEAETLEEEQRVMAYRIPSSQYPKGLLTPGDLRKLIETASKNKGFESSARMYESIREIAYRYIGESLQQLVG